MGTVYNAVLFRGSTYLYKRTANSPMPSYAFLIMYKIGMECLLNCPSCIETCRFLNKDNIINASYIFKLSAKLKSIFEKSDKSYMNLDFFVIL